MQECGCRKMITAQGRADVIIDAILAGFGLVIALLTVALLHRMVTRIAQRGKIPVTIDARELQNSGSDAEVGISSEVRELDLLVARVQEYITKDARLPAASSPGGAGATVPATPTDTATSAEGFIASLIAGLTRKSSYDIHLKLFGEAAPPTNQPTRSTQKRTVGIEIVREPKGRVVAAGTISGFNEVELIEEIGCFCLRHIDIQSNYLRRTPRWERWDSDIEAYQWFRRGLACEEHENYATALACFDEGIKREPRNLLLHSRKGELCEFMANDKKTKAIESTNSTAAAEAHRRFAKLYEDAIFQYVNCKKLWPERIEISYRLAIVISNNSDFKRGYRASEEMSLLNDLERDLRLRSLLANMCRTLMPLQGNIGERIHWMTWLRPKWSCTTDHRQRSHYRAAIQVSRTILQLKRIRREMALRGEAPTLDDRRAVDDILENFAKEFSRKWPRRPTRVNVFLPQETRTAFKGYRQCKIYEHPTFTRHFEGRTRRRRIGWLAHFNAACLFSLLVDFRDVYDLPQKWEESCLRAAKHQLEMVLRDPAARVTPGWFERDPDLYKFRRSNPEWMAFIGVARASQKVAEHNFDATTSHGDLSSLLERRAHQALEARPTVGSQRRFPAPEI